MLEANVAQRALPAVYAALALTAQSAFAAVGPVLASALEREPPTDLAARIDRLIPEQTVSLREVAVWALRTLLAGRFSGSEDDQAERARLLNNLGSRLSELGQREAALAATREAVGTYCEVAEQRPALIPAAASQFEISLRNLVDQLKELQRVPEEEPVVIRARTLLQRAR